MPSSCGQPIILSVITTDLGSCRVDEREHFFCYAGIIADISAFGEPASKVGSVGILGRHDADGELGGSGIVWVVEGDGRNGVAAKSSLGSLAQPLACTLNHLFLVARRLPLAILGHRAQIFYRSRMVPRLLAWTEAMLSQPLACVLAI